MDVPKPLLWSYFLDELNCVSVFVFLQQPLKLCHLKRPWRSMEVMSLWVILESSSAHFVLRAQHAPAHGMLSFLYKIFKKNVLCLRMFFDIITRLTPLSPPSSLTQTCNEWTQFRFPSIIITKVISFVIVIVQVTCTAYNAVWMLNLSEMDK